MISKLQKKSTKVINYGTDLFGQAHFNHDLEKIYSGCGLFNKFHTVLWIDHMRINKTLSIWNMRIKK